METYQDILKSIGIETLGHGGHRDCEGACLIEAYALLVGRPKTDDPGEDILCPVLRTASIGINDAIKDDGRRTELLAPLLVRLKVAGPSSETLLSQLIDMREDG